MLFLLLNIFFIILFVNWLIRDYKFLKSVVKDKESSQIVFKTIFVVLMAELVVINLWQVVRYFN